MTGNILLPALRARQRVMFRSRRIGLAMTGGKPITAIMASLSMSAALAFPEGAPWGAADPDADEHCGSCHFGYDATLDAINITIKGLPETAAPGQTYELQVSFADSEAAIAGFQSLATSGEFYAENGNIEYFGAAIRSTKPSPADAGFDWTLSWTAPEAPGAAVIIYVAVVAGNDDLSPFGDRAFFRAFEIDL